MSAEIVHLVDDDEAVRDSLEFLLTSSGRAVRTYASAEDFLERNPGGAAGTILVDVRMPGMGGIDLLKKLKADGPPVNVIVITGHADVPLAVEAMKAGAHDFIQKPFEEDQLRASIAACEALRHNEHAQARDAAGLQSRYASLTPREREVMGKLMTGYANKTIAYDLGISARTVEIYRANVMTKMQATNLSQLVRMGIQLGI